MKRLSLLQKKPFMRLFFIFLLMLICSFPLLAQTFAISGRVGDSTTQVLLKKLNPETGEYELVEEQSPVKGIYEFRLVPEVTLYQVIFGNKKAIPVSALSEENVLINCMDQVEIIASPSTQKMKDFEQLNKELQIKYFAQLKKEADTAMALDDQEALKSIQERSGQAIQKFLVEFHAAIEALGVSPEGFHALQYTDFNKDKEFVRDRLAKFQEELPGSPVTRALEKKVVLSAVLAVGQRPANFKLRDLKGIEFELEKVQAKVLLIDFWAAWCRACRIENPEFARLYDSFGSKGLEIVSISKDDNEETWKKAIRKDGIGAWIHLWDRDEEVSTLYGVSSLPQNLVLDEKGTIIAMNVKANQLEDILKRRL
jgi:peroxiredoxin